MAVTVNQPFASAAPRRLLALRTDRRRTRVDRFMRGLTVAAMVVCIIPLVAVIAYVTINGLAAINLDLLTKPPKALGVGGGAAAAILGSLQMVSLATVMAVPAGILSSVYVSEFAGTRTAAGIRFAADVLAGVPSILVGIFTFTILVLPFQQYNAFAGSVALAIIMWPIVLRTTEEILALVPGTLREASLALGVQRWRTVLSIVVRTGLAGILTGVMLAVARAAGETAPLLFTALGSRLINVGNWQRPMDALPLFIYQNARQPYPVLNAQAWGAAFLLMLFVLVVNIAVRARSMGRRTY
jgi:phosphate transport system permease protein